YTYDRLGRRLTETTKLAATIATGSPQTIAYGYDAVGRRTQITYPDGSMLRYTYDGQNRLATVATEGTPPLATYAYDLDGMVTSVTRENGVRSSYAYDLLGRLLNVSHARGATVLASSAYTLD